MCVFIKLPATAQSSPVILVILCQATRIDPPKGGSVMCMFFTLTDRVSSIGPSNILRGCQSGTWCAGQTSVVLETLLRGTGPALCKLSCVSKWWEPSEPSPNEQAATPSYVDKLYFFLGRCSGPIVSRYILPTPLIPSFVLPEQKQLGSETIQNCLRYVTSTEVTVM